MQRSKRYIHNIPAARVLRQRETASEALLWERLRDRRLGGLKFRRQHAIGPYVVDFFCAGAALAIEVDGSVHDGAAIRSADHDRQLTIEQRGIRFLRVTAATVESDIEAVLGAILNVATKRADSPSAAKSGEGAGG